MLPAACSASSSHEQEQTVAWFMYVALRQNVVL